MLSPDFTIHRLAHNIVTTAPMKWKPFLYGSATGLALGLLLSIGTTSALRTLPESNLVNFGPAIFGTGIFALEALGFAIALIAGLIFLVRRRWKLAGFCIAFGVAAIAWCARVLLY